MKKGLVGLLALGTGLVLFLSAGRSDSSQKSLYERLGGEETLRSLAGDFVARAVSDPEVNFSRHGTPNHWQASPASINHLIEDFADYFGQITGGPYLQKVDLKAIHSGMQITHDEFDAFLTDLRASLNRLNIPEQEQEELMTMVGSTRADIVEVIQKKKNKK